MKIAVAQLEVRAGHPDINLEKILKEITSEKDKGTDIVVFSEMVVGGYLLGDEWENNSLMDELMSANEIIRQASAGIVVIWGNVYVDKNKKGEDGRWRKYNSVFIAQNQEWVSNGVFEGRSYKTLMPKYREFDDERHFYSLAKLAGEKMMTIDSILQPFEVEIRGKKHKLGLMLCEDMWSSDYSIKPGEILVKNGAEMLINLSCSPWTWRKNEKRHKVVKDLLEKTKVPFVYCNNVGTQNNGKNVFLFDGNSTFYDKNGEIVRQAGDYTEETIEVEVDLNSKEFVMDLPAGRQVPGQARNDPADSFAVRRAGTDESDIENLYTGLVYGIGKFFETLPSKKVVIGLSGGIDSAVVACLLVKSLGKENVVAINMPSIFNSGLTKSAAKKLAENLGVNYKIIPIQESVNLTVKQMEEAGFTVSNFAVENIQARDRGSRILAGVASVVNGVFVNNGNKTETALGYCTLYGDVDGALAPIADVYKGQVYELAEYINYVNGTELIPAEIIKVVPSAELSSEQDVTKGKGDPMIYPYHDKLIRSFVEWRWDIEEILSRYDNKTLSSDLELEKNVDDYFETREKFIEDLEHKWRLYKLNIFKRIQAPPIIAVSKRAFGFDLREAQNRVYLTKEFLDKKKPL